jgi:hypothetical protein
MAVFSRYLTTLEVAVNAFYNHHQDNIRFSYRLSFAKTPADLLRCCNIVTAMILARDRVISVLQSKSRQIRTQWKCWVSLPKKVEVLEMS